MTHDDFAVGVTVAGVLGRILKNGLGFRRDDILIEREIDDVIPRRERRGAAAAEEEPAAGEAGEEAEAAGAEEAEAAGEPRTHTADPASANDLRHVHD